MDARLEHGRRPAGADHTTMLLWHAISDAGETGITRDELVTVVGPRVNAGHAKRRYLVHLEREHRRRNCVANGLATQFPTFENLDLDRAKNFFVTSTLSNMRKHGTANRDDQGRYRAGRKPRAPRYQQDEAVLDPTGARTRMLMNSNEAIRAVRQLLERHEQSFRAKPNQREWRAIERLVALHEEALGWSQASSVNGKAGDNAATV